MGNIDQTYRKLTGVDIAQQKLLWDERGKGYYGEYLVFKELYPNLTGCCKILMNLEIPALGGKKTEIDLLLIHETGLYVFEMKHYKGTIYGKTHENRWTQYFRTTSNNAFYNPVRQNQYHIQALQTRFPGIPVHSFIVFTSAECDLRVECNEPNITVCQLQELPAKLAILKEKIQVFGMDQIDNLFTDLSAFSPISSKPVEVAAEVIPFGPYLQTLIQDVQHGKKQLEEQILKAEKAAFRIGKMAVLAVALCCVACIAVAFLACSGYQKAANAQVAAAEQALSDYAHQFEHVEIYNNGEIELARDLITTSDVSLEKSNDVVNALNFNCTLNWNGTEYGTQLTEDTKYLIQLKDGNVKEYDLFSKEFPCYPSHKLGKGAYSQFELPTLEIYDLNLSDISYIKLSNLKVWKYLTNYGNPLWEGFEVELYSVD